jgi:hypothetical protein
MTTSTVKPRAFSPVPPSAATAALATADTCAAIGAVSVSYWHEAVRTGLAPRPVIQQTRFTRWRLVDAVQFWQDRATQGQADTASAQALTARATKASNKAREAAAITKAKVHGASAPPLPAQQAARGGA